MSTILLKDSNGNPLRTSNSEPLRALQPITVDLTTLGLTAGTYQLRAKLRGTGYQDSDYSSPIINYTVYSITKTITNGTATGDTVMYPGVDATTTIVPDNNYTLPATSGDITVVGATLKSYDSSTGVAVLENVTANVTVSATCESVASGYKVVLSGNYGDGEHVYVQINNDSTWYYAEMGVGGGFFLLGSNIPNIYEEAGGSITIPNVSKIKIGTLGDPTLTTGPKYRSTWSTGDFANLTFVPIQDIEVNYATGEITMTQDSTIGFQGDD